MRSRLATLTTALAEVVVGGWLWLDRFAAYRSAYYAAIRDAGWDGAAARPQFDDSTLFRYYGNDAVMFLGFFVSPWGLVATFLVLEGVVRALHALVTGEGCGFLLVFLAQRLHRRRPAVVPDRVTRYPDGTACVIGAAHDWDALTTFILDDRRYVLSERVPVGKLVRYVLRPAPDNHLARGIVHLDAP